MANSNSAHSKQVRYNTSNEWQKKNTIQKNYRININNPEDLENLNVLEEMEGDLVDKFREIFRVYKKYKE